MHGYPARRGRLTLPSLSKSCLPETEWGGTTIARRTQSIFYPSVGDSASVLSLSRTYTTSQQSQRQAKKEPATLPPSLLTSSYYPALSLFVFATLSFIISSQRFTDAITFFPPDHVKWVPGNSLWQKCRLNLWNPKGSGAFFFKQARLPGWQLAQLRPVTLSQHLSRG